MDEDSNGRTPEESHVDHVIDQLNRRLIQKGDRMRLRRAVDKADAPQAGRAGADDGLRDAIIRRVSH